MTIPVRLLLMLVCVLNAALGSRLYADNLDTTTNLVVWFNFANTPVGGVVPDQSPVGTNSGTITNFTTWAASQDGHNGVMLFTGTDPDGITVQPAVSLNSTTGTIAFWMESSQVTPTPNPYAAVINRKSAFGEQVYQAPDGHLANQTVNGGVVNAQETTVNITDGSWHHIAYVYDQSASGSIAIYVDGVLNTTHANSAAWSWDANQRIEIGFSHETFWSGFGGYLDDIRIYNRKLTGSEVASLAGLAPTPLILIQTQPQSKTVAVGDTASFKVQATVINGTNGPSYQWQKVSGGTTNDIAGATNASYSVQPVLADNGSAFQALLTYPGATNVTSAQAILTVVPEFNVIYSFDADPVGGVIVDSSTNTTAPHDGVNNGATWVSSQDGRNGVMSFDGFAFNQITLAPTSELNSSRGTIAFWMQSTSVTPIPNPYAMIFDRRSANGGEVIYQDPSAHVSYQTRNSGAQVNSGATSFNSIDGVWHHVAYVYDQSAGGAILLYVDGALTSSNVNSQAWSWDPNQQVEIGLSHDSFWSAYSGYLDDFRIYNRVLTPSEVAALAGISQPLIVIQTQPTSVVIGNGEQPQFTVAATVVNGNAAQITYAWQKNGINIPGATNATYTFTAAPADSGANFKAVLSYSGATNITSATVSLTVVPEFVVHYEFLQDPALNGNVIVDTSTVGTNSGLNGGSLYAPATWLASYNGHTNVMSFDGSIPNQITIATNVTLNSLRGTVAFWMVSPQVTQSPNPYACVFSHKSGDGELIYQAPDGHLAQQSAFNSQVANGQETTINITDNQWHHIAYVYDQNAGGSISLYVDGVLNTTHANSSAWIWDPNAEIEFGKSHDPFWSAYTGYLADFRIYSRRLSDVEIAQLAGVPTVSPTLSITVAGGQATISWSGGAGFVLQQNSNLANPAGWTNVSGGNVSPVVLPLSGSGNQFYRLIK